MSRTQRKMLKNRVRANVKIRKAELKKLTGACARYHFQRDRAYKVALVQLRKEIRFYSRLGKRI